MLKYFIVGLFLISIVSAQTTEELTIDTTHSYNLNQADLVLHIMVKNRSALGGPNSTIYIGYVECEVLKVIKGEFDLGPVKWHMDIVVWDDKTWDPKYEAVWEKERKDGWEKRVFEVYVGFKKEVFYTSDIKDKTTQKEYLFYMASKELPK